MKNLLNTEVTLSTASAGDFSGMNISPFQLYKMRFYGLGLKDIPPSIKKTDSGKKYLIYGKAKLLGTHIDIYFMALQEMSPVVVVVGIIAGACTLLGISLLIIKEIKNISPIFYAGVFAVFGLVYFRKPIVKKLKL